MDAVTNLLNQAKCLPPRERLQLIQELLISLDSSYENVSAADWNAAWLSELEARVVAFERGEVPSSSWPDVMERLRQSLDTSQSS